jgi:hypothetical protein
MYTDENKIEKGEGRKNKLPMGDILTHNAPSSFTTATTAWIVFSSTTADINAEQY